MKIFTTAFALLVLPSIGFAQSCQQNSHCQSSQANDVHQVAVYHSNNDDAAAKTEAKDIVDTAVGAGTFNTLVAAVKAAGLVDTLKKPGPYTVFAPSDEAFAKLPKGTVENLLKPENLKQLQAILTYHVVPGSLNAKDVVRLSGAKTAQGELVDFKAENGKVMVGTAQVIKTDIATSNGVIHVIDSVIMPPKK